MALLDIPPVCQSTDSATCSVMWDWTHNEFLARSSAWLIGKPAACLAIIVIGVLVRWLLHRAIDRVVRRAELGVVPSGISGLTQRVERARRTTAPEGAEAVDDEEAPTPHAQVITNRRAQRAKSLGSLLKSLTTMVVFGIVFVMVLDQVGVNVAPIIASAGVVGLAIGFGAQSLVKDFLAGIAMMLEDQYGVGDSVDVGEASGTVEAVGLRVTRLRDVEGTVWYVRNGEILRVGNQSQNWARTVLDISVGYHENLARVRTILKDVAHQLWEDPAFRPVIIEEPEVWGVQSLSPEAVVVRVTLKTAPLEQWRVAREMRERIKDRFDSEGIAMPQRVAWTAPTEGS